MIYKLSFFLLSPIALMTVKNVIQIAISLLNNGRREGRDILLKLFHLFVRFTTNYYYNHLCFILIVGYVL